MTPGKLFAALSFVFVSVLMIVVFYEVLTGNLPSDDKNKLGNISHKYGPDFFNTEYKEQEGDFNNPFIPNASGYNFVYCFDEDSQRNITYPEGTECFDDAEDQDDYNYSENDKGKIKTEEKEKDRDRDEEDEENKYSVEICPPKCGRDDNDDEDENEENEEDEDE